MKQLLEYLRTPRHLALLIAAVSAAVLSAAYISQYGFGLRPCTLCLYQRTPYALNISFGVLAFLATYRYPRITTLLLYLSVVVFFIGAAIAGFHTGVEQGWWPGLSACGGGGIPPESASAEELRRFLATQPIVRCDEPAWTLLGISMAGYNFAVSLGLGIGLLFLLRKDRS